MDFLKRLDDLSTGDAFLCHGNYEAPLLQATVATTAKTTGALWVGASARRMRVYEIEMGQTGTLNSTDVQCEWLLSRFSATAILTITSVTPNLLDPADVACSASFGNNATAEPTFTTAGAGLKLKEWAINQRGSYRWRALDDGDQIVIPGTSQAGVGLQTLSSGFTASAVGNISFVE